MTERPSTPAADEILGRYFPVLDHGFVSLVDYMGTDTCVERAARVSYGYGTRATNETRGLIRFLRRHLHTTPSEMIELKFHCAMPIFVARQWIRHRTANVNEYSGRYSLMPMIFYTPAREQMQPQSKSNRQGRAGEPVSQETYDEALRYMKQSRANVVAEYEWMTEQDVARELARIDLPLSTYTQWYWKIDVHNLMHFLGLRVDAHAQWEIREYGKVMAGMLERVAPLSYEAWMDYNVNAVRLSHQEWELIKGFIELGELKEAIDAFRADKSGTLNGRELDELEAKLARQPLTLESLDLSKAVAGEVFERRYAEAAPKST